MKTVSMFQNLPLGSIIQFITALAALAVVAMLWKNRKSTEVKFLILVQVCVAIWAIFYGAEFSATLVNKKILWSQLSYLGIGFLPMSYFFFTLAYRQQQGAIKTSNIVLAGFLPVITIVLALTNQHHHLVWEEVDLQAGSNMLQYVHGLWFWVFYIYAFGLIVWGLINLILAFFEFNKIYRSQIIILLFASVIPVVGNLAYVTGLNPIPGYDWTTSLFVLTGLTITIGVYRHRMFEIIPLATRQLFKILKEGIIVINKDGMIEDANPATYDIFKLHNRILNMPFAQVFSNHKGILEALKNDTDSSLNLEMKEDNVSTYYQVKISMIRDSRGEINGKMIIVNNVTSIRKSEFELRSRNKQLMRKIEKNEKLIADLDSFAHTVAHDLKNMLGAIYSSSEAVIDSLQQGNTEFVMEASLLVKESAVKTIQITDDLMKLATSGYDDVQKEPVDMGKIFDQAKAQLSDLFKQYDASVQVENEWLQVVAYGPWLEEVCINYISNAIKYGGRPPVMHVGCGESGKGKVKFWIRDNGDGLAPEHQKAVFEKHTRFHKDKAFGYGLGLSIVKRIVEKMGGKVGVQSNGVPGKGAEFYFILPASNH